MSISSKFSSMTYHARVDLGLTQREVAEAASISVRWYQRIEKGERLPSAIVMLRIIIFLDINVKELREEVGIVVPVSSLQRDAVFQ